MVHFHEHDAKIGHVNKTNFSSNYLFKDGATNRVHFNNLGFRTESTYTEEEIAELGRIKIFAVGDSTTVAFEVEGQQTYPSVLQEQLGQDYLVINAGTRGYDTQQVVIQYMTKLSKLKPDVLIYMICQNDFDQNIDNYLYKDLVSYYGKGYIDTGDKKLLKFIEPNWDLFQRIKVLLEGNLRLTYSTLHFIKHTFMEFFYSLEDDNESSKINKMEELLSVLDKISGRFGTRVYVAFFPEEELFSTAQIEFSAKPAFHRYKEIKNYIQKDLANTTLIPTYDFFLAQDPKHLRKSPFHFEKDKHANVAGNHIIGSYIAEFLTRNPRATSDGSQ